MCAFTCVLYAKLLSDLFFSLRVSYYNYQDEVMAHNFVCWGFERRNRKKNFQLTVSSDDDDDDDANKGNTAKKKLFYDWRHQWKAKE